MGVTSFQKIYGLYGLKHHTVEKSEDVTRRDGRTNKLTRKDRATQLLICEKLSLAITLIRVKRREAHALRYGATMEKRRLA